LQQNIFILYDNFRLLLSVESPVLQKLARSTTCLCSRYQRQVVMSGVPNQSIVTIRMPVEI